MLIYGLVFPLVFHTNTLHTSIHTVLYMIPFAYCGQYWHALYALRVDEFKQQLYFLHQNISSNSNKMQELHENTEQLVALFHKIDQMEVCGRTVYSVSSIRWRGVCDSLLCPPHGRTDGGVCMTACKICPPLQDTMSSTK